MTEAAHTPGPWEVDEGCWPVVVNGPQDELERDVVCYVDAADANGDGCYLAHTALANAHLIAAAPELLYALDALLATAFSADESRLALVVGNGPAMANPEHINGRSLHARCDAIKVAFDTARAARAKARGTA